MARSTFILFMMAVIIGRTISYSSTGIGNNIPPCMQPALTGLCYAYFPSWFYNPASGKCESFVYGGCRGNDNRFPSEQACMQKCGNFKLENKDFKLILETDEVNPTSRKLFEYGNQQVEDDRGASVCALKSETGPCLAMMKRYYFNGAKCEEFIFGGCRGNENNFKTVEDCKQKCEKVILN